MGETADPTLELSAKIKPILLELHNYSFFHSPSEIGNVDERFIGRTSIIDKLKTLLTNHATKSGCYLVTGYRGAGKSSLVAKVFSEISSGYGRSGLRTRYFRILAPLVPLALFDVSAVGPAWLAFGFPMSTIVALLFALFYLVRTDPRRDDLALGSRKQAPRLLLILSAIGRTFLVDGGRSPNLRFRTLIQDIYLFLLIHVVALACLELRTRWSIAARLSLYLGLYLCLLLLILSANQYRHANRSSGNGNSVWHVLRERAWHAVRNYVNYSHRIYIKINLGQDDLEEIEILRLIATNIHTKYQSFKRVSLANMFWRTALALVLFFVVGTIYFSRQVYELNRGLKVDFQVCRYLPTQCSFLLAKDTQTLDEILEMKSGASTVQGRPFRLDQFAKDFDFSLKSIYHYLAPVVTVRAGSPLRQAAVRALVYGDIFVHITYTKLRNNLPLIRDIPALQINRFTYYYFVPVSRDFQIVPQQIDYLFLLYLLLAACVLRRLSQLNLFGLVTHGFVLHRLQELKDAIDAQITRERGGSIGGGGGKLPFGLSRSTSHVYPIASLRDIEKRLIEILDWIDQIPRLTVRPNFIFIFDELDKIEPHQNLALTEKEEEGGSAAPSSFDASRERQHRILGLLSNLKHFFTTARAKFIFVAGREMFDASLADVSDRHFFMGSIFNDVIYVPSFLRDPSDGKLADITSMTEFYVCRLLLPTHYRDCDVSLHTYSSYLRDEFFSEAGVCEHEKHLRRLRHHKVVTKLSEFIIYLTYRSNGAPKKIGRLLESYIKTCSPEELHSPHRLAVGKCSGNLYLEFGHYDQYTFGLVTYIANPLFLTLNKAIKDFGDKLLVSTSFLLDQVYKFHGFGFSWRNLELIPEIVDVNKAPELRQVISSIIQFLTRAHIDEIVSGLYDFKFRKQVIEEIAFLSKVSEREAAAFNFTLDESIALKRYYNRELRRLLGIYSSYATLVTEAHYIHSIGYLRMILGDLHFYDEEYDQAILEYMEALQPFQNIEADKLNLHRLVVVTRNYLKLGLAFERKKSFESAFVTYGKIASLIMQFRNVDPKDFGLNEKVETAGLRDKLLEGEFDLSHEKLALKRSAFQGVRLLYQPLIAKLQVMEKSNLGGVTQADLETLEQEFEFIVRLFNEDESYLIRAEFYEKVGDVLYYKNSTTWPARVYYERSLAFLSRNALGLREVTCIRPQEIYKMIDSGRAFGHRSGALKEIAMSLSDLGDALLGEETTARSDLSESFLRSALGLLATVTWDKTRRLRQMTGKRALNAIQEVILWYMLSAVFYKNAGEHRAHALQLTKILFVIRELIATRQLSLSADTLDQIEKDLVSRAIRGVYRTYESSHRLEIETFQQILLPEDPDSSPYPRPSAVALDNISVSFDVREIVIIFQEIRLKTKARARQVERTRAESKKPAASKTNPPMLEPDLGPYRFTSPYSSMNSIYNRIHELRYRGNVNYENFDLLGFAEVDDETKKEELEKLLSSVQLPADFRQLLSLASDGLQDQKARDEREAPRLLLEFLITDSIFCFHEIVRSLRIYGVSFMANHSMRAAAHEKLADWCYFYYAYLKNSETEHQERISARLRSLIGSADMITITPRYHIELALIHYRSAKEAHGEGRAYRELIEKMFYLNDDFNDKLTHFCAGLERYRIRAGIIDTRIQTLAARLEPTTVYDQRRYYYGPSGLPDPVDDWSPEENDAAENGDREATGRSPLLAVSQFAQQGGQAGEIEIALVP